MKLEANITARKQLGTPFRKGESGNPKGRPKGSISFTAALRRKLLEIPFGDRKNHLEQLVDVILEKALRGDFKMIKLVWNYVDGPPKSHVELGTDGESIEELTSFFRQMATAQSQPPKHNSQSYLGSSDHPTNP